MNSTYFQLFLESIEFDTSELNELLKNEFDPKRVNNEQDLSKLFKVPQVSKNSIPTTSENALELIEQDLDKIYNLINSKQSKIPSPFATIESKKESSYFETKSKPRNSELELLKTLNSEIFNSFILISLKN